MKADMLARLNGINQEFYQTFADSFSRSRYSIQAGVGRILEKLPRTGDFLDIGCGNGNLARKWLKSGFSGTFIGVDFSPGLIDAARKNATPVNEDQSVGFHLCDLTHNLWMEVLPDLAWDEVFCFAVLHHIPGFEERTRLCRQIKALSNPHSDVWISVWQPYNSRRLNKRILDWGILDIKDDLLEKGDVLMDWRAHGNHEAQPAYRYVHIFDEDELMELAELSGFTVEDQFYSDGKERNIGLYQKWSAKDFYKI